MACWRPVVLDRRPMRRVGASAFVHHVIGRFLSTGVHGGRDPSDPSHPSMAHRPLRAEPRACGRRSDVCVSRDDAAAHVACRQRQRVGIIAFRAANGCARRAACRRATPASPATSTTPAARAQAGHRSVVLRRRRRAASARRALRAQRRRRLRHTAMRDARRAAPAAGCEQPLTNGSPPVGHDLWRMNSSARTRILRRSGRACAPDPPSRSAGNRP